MKNERMNTVLAELKEYARLKKELEDEISKLQNECKEYMVENDLEELFNDDNTIVARYTEVISTRFDSTSFKKSDPSLIKILFRSQKKTPNARWLKKLHPRREEKILTNAL